MEQKAAVGWRLIGARHGAADPRAPGRGGPKTLSAGTLDGALEGPER